LQWDWPVWAPATNAYARSPYSANASHTEPSATNTYTHRDRHRKMDTHLPTCVDRLNPLPLWSLRLLRAPWPSCAQWILARRFTHSFWPGGCTSSSATCCASMKQAQAPSTATPSWLKCVCVCVCAPTIHTYIMTGVDRSPPATSLSVCVCVCVCRSHPPFGRTQSKRNPVYSTKLLTHTHTHTHTDTDIDIDTHTGRRHMPPWRRLPNVTLRSPHPPPSPLIRLTDSFNHSLTA
jgi:hypothetical protein